MAHTTDSMEALAERFGDLDIGLSSFPLTDDSLASDWSKVRSAETRASWGTEWAIKRKELTCAVSARDFTAILAYEIDGAKMDAKLGYPSLALWLDALTSRETEGWSLDKENLQAALSQLIDTGASVRAFQALQPDALGLILSSESSKKRSPLWDEVVLLLDSGWNPNQWNPLEKAASGMSSIHALLGAGNRVHSRPGKDGKACSYDEAEAGWTRIFSAAMRAGFNLDSRALDGQSALGICLAERPYSLKKEQDARIGALLALGANPAKSSRFWVSVFDTDPMIHSAMLEQLESSQIAAAASDAASRRKPSL
jgi:hypothetical protein